MNRTIAVLGGTGPEGSGLALRWARAGETVIIGSRDAQRAQDAAAKIKEKVGSQAPVSGMDNSAACAAADIVVLTVPFEGHAALLKQIKNSIRPDSIVIDATVPLAAASEDGPPALSESGRVQPLRPPLNSFLKAPRWSPRFTILPPKC